MGWQVERSVGSAIDFHQRDLEPGPSGAVWIHEVTSPALVLGSTQSEGLIDASAARAAGWEVGRRRSGGGVVALEPGGSLWVDIAIPRTHPRWEDDVGRSFLWVGQAWVQALVDLAAKPTRPTQGGLRRPVVHDGPPEHREAGKVVCFAGIGPGEVVLTDGQGRRHKIIGLSQRRGRMGARFQCLLLLDWNPEPFLRFGTPELRAVVQESTSIGWPSDMIRPTIHQAEQALLTALVR